MKFVIISALILSTVAVGACRREVPHTPIYDKQVGYYK